MSVPDLIAAPLLIGGSALIALGSLGLIRFPDVLTRMHAATKAATLGVVATTVAAAVEAGALGGILILVLVVALLFLSGPLGMSLLARVALTTPRRCCHPTPGRCLLPRLLRSRLSHCLAGAPAGSWASCSVRSGSPSSGRWNLT